MQQLVKFYEIMKPHVQTCIDMYRADKVNKSPISWKVKNGSYELTLYITNTSHSNNNWISIELSHENNYKKEVSISLFFDILPEDLDNHALFLEHNSTYEDRLHQAVRISKNFSESTIGVSPRNLTTKSGDLQKVFLEYPIQEDEYFQKSTAHHLMQEEFYDHFMHESTLLDPKCSCITISTRTDDELMQVLNDDELMKRFSDSLKLQLAVLHQTVLK